MIRLTTLGALDLAHDDGRSADSILKRPKRLALLAYLASAGPGSLRSRDTVFGIFWPDLDQGRARQALNQALYVLRNALGRDVLVSLGNDQIGIGEGELWCDASALRRAVEEDRHEDAVALYGGDFLPGLFLPDVPEFEKWLDGEREELRRSAAGAAWRLAEQAAGRGDRIAAADAAIRSVELDPFHEAGARRAIRFIAAGGDRGRALSLYESFAERLKDELDAEPSAETRQLVAELRAPTAGSDPPSAQATALKARPAAARAAASGSGPAGASAATLATAGATSAPLARDAHGGRRRRHRLYAAAGIVVALVVGGLLFARTSGGPSGATGAVVPALNDPPRIMIESLEGGAEGSAPAGVATALTSAIAGGLSDVDGLEVVVGGAAPATVEESIAAGTRAAPTRPAFVVRGQVMEGDGLLRLNLTLSDAATGEVVGHASLQRAGLRPLAFVDEIAPAAIDMIRARVGREMEERRWRAGTDDVRAWRLVERAERDRRQARQLWRRGAMGAAADALANADSLLARAEEEAGDWIQPVVLRARVEYDRFWLSLMAPQQFGDEALPRLEQGLAHAERALDRNPRDARAVEVKGLLLRWLPHVQRGTAEDAVASLERAEAVLRQAVERNPSSVAAWNALSVSLHLRGEFREAYYAARQALEADTYLDQPMESLVRVFSSAFEAHDDDAARQACDETRRRFPGNWIVAECALTLLAWVEPPAAGQVDSAWALAADLPPDHPTAPRHRMLVANVIARHGMADSALAVAARVHGGKSTDPYLDRLHAAMLGTLGERDSAVALLRRYIQAQPLGGLGAPRSRMLLSLSEPMPLKNR